MDHNTISNVKIHTYSESDPLSSTKNAENQSGLSFLDTLSNYLPNIKQPNVHEMIEQYKMEKREIINMLLEEFRTQSETKRMELIEKLLSGGKNDDEDPYSKCLDIFRKLMRGEKVSPEELRYLMQFAPLLFILYQMLKDDDVKIEEDKSEEENSDKSADSDASKGSSSIAQAVISYAPDTSAAAM